MPKKYRLRRKTQQGYRIVLQSIFQLNKCVFNKILTFADGWSVTFSNNHDDEVEMKFKFPSLSSKRQTSKKSGEKCKNPGKTFDISCFFYE